MPVSDTLNLIDHQLDGSPLAEVGRRLKLFLMEAKTAADAGIGRPRQMDSAIGFVENTLRSMPQSFGRRFYFDSILIQSIAQEWSGRERVSSMIVPHYGSDFWAHARIQMPHESTRHSHVIELILFPGKDDTQSVDLLTYPWLLHELGHCMLFRAPDFVPKRFTPRLHALIASLKLRGIADRGPTKDRARHIIEWLPKYWTPNAAHFDWSHEIIVDIIGLWTCGPCYLAAFHYEASKTNRDPYHLTEGHPPFDLRASSLIYAGKELGWEADTKPLQKMAQNWQDSESEFRRTNEYTAYTSQELTYNCVTVGIELCQELRLPRCTSEHMEAVRATTSESIPPASGTDLILAAHTMYGVKGEALYRDWERNIVISLASDIT